jgi:hypothetical protein
MGNLKHLVRELGGENRFPILTKYLPVVNHGIIPVEFAGQILDELIQLEKGQSIIGMYAYMIEPLKKVIQASVQTGNPVHWS